MNERVVVRVTKRSKPLFVQIEEIAQSRQAGQNEFTSTLLDILELGLLTYESGHRVMDNEIIQKSSISKLSQRSTYSVFNEVAETLYSGLAGAIANLSYYEEDKPKPNLDLLKFYDLIGKALWCQKNKFNKFTDEQIKKTVSILSPIKKSLFGNLDEQQQVIDNNKLFFDSLIAETGAVND